MKREKKHTALVTIRLPQWEKDQIEVESLNSGKSVSQIIRERMAHVDDFNPLDGSVSDGSMSDNL